MVSVAAPTLAELRTFKRACAALRKLAKEGFYLYMEDDNLNLMDGPSHEGNGVPQHDRVIATEHLPRAGGGAW